MLLFKRIAFNAWTDNDERLEFLLRAIDGLVTAVPRSRAGPVAFESLGFTLVLDALGSDTGAGDPNGGNSASVKERFGPGVESEVGVGPEVMLRDRNRVERQGHFEK